MTVRWPRVAAVVVAGAAFALPTAAHADGATINPGNVPATAENACSGGGSHAGQDVWAFVLPDITRNFVSITAVFDSDLDGTADARRTAPADGGITDDNGASKGWVFAPAGWTLITATAVVTDGTGDVEFNLTRTCPAGASSSPRPYAAGPSPSGAGAVGPDTTPRSGRGSPSASPATTPLGADSRLPSDASRLPGGAMPDNDPDSGVDGANAVGAYLIAGGTLLAGVVAANLLVIARRRRYFI